jgi:carboxymethylenebutenolidase
MNVQISGPAGPIPTYIAAPDGPGPWPGVVVIHDALGMTADLRNQADWLAGAGFLAAAPDLFAGGGRVRCLVRVMRDAVRRSGATFATLAAVRGWLAQRPDCTGRIGVIGFCLGGGFAVLLAADPGYDASSVNYGNVPGDAAALLAHACPVVGSYGAADPTLRDDAERLEQVLQASGIAHDVAVYPRAGHSFLNDHDPSDVPAWAAVAGALSKSAYHEPSAVDARRRIVAFFDEHLRTRADGASLSGG